jgi:hypothetical protein
MKFAPMGPFMTELYPTDIRGTGQGFYYNAGRAIGSIFLTANWVCDGDNAAYPTVVRASDASPPPVKTGCASTPTGGYFGE